MCLIYSILGALRERSRVAAVCMDLIEIEACAVGTLYIRRQLLRKALEFMRLLFVLLLLENLEKIIEAMRWMVMFNVMQGRRGKERRDGKMVICGGSASCHLEGIVVPNGFALSFIVLEVIACDSRVCASGRLQ